MNVAAEKISNENLNIFLQESKKITAGFEPIHFEELAHWESFTPSGNMGKWGRQVRLDKITEKLKKVQEKIHFHDSIYLSNEIYNEWKKDVK